MPESILSSLQKPGVRATWLACLFFSGFGCLIPFLPLWLEKAQGFSGSQIGLVLAIGGFSRIIAGPLTAAWADGRSDRRAPMFLFAAILTIGFGALWFVTGFAAIFTIILLMDVAFWGLLPVVEAALLRLTKYGWPRYGVARGLASAAFVVGSSAVGALIGGYGPWAVWAWLLGVSILLIAAAAWMPAEQVAGDTEAPFMQRLSAGVGMLKDRKFALLIFAAGLIQATHSYFYVAGTLIWTNDQQLSSTLSGNLWSIGVIAEVGFLIFMARWTERFAPETLILVGGISAVVRWSALAMLPPVWALYGLQIMHAGTFAATFLGAMRMIQALHGDDRTPTAQMMYMALASAPAQALTTLLSGELYERLKVDGHAAWGYFSMTGVAVLGLALAVMLWLKRDSVGLPQPAAA
ncbi:MFS transporter [Sandarakinorhabdus sp.]|uniref:MFS transporter n=1 Tax=Sandarakinorhabdus sp. TaxID=1916663 RepID=UPI00286E9736|nr:MFS transporter [Sandarakinorhabdus sp.]